MGTRNALCAALAGALLSVFVGASALAQDAPVPKEGSLITLTRQAVLNGVTLPKGTMLKVAGLKRDTSGAVNRVDLEQLAGDHQVFKSITLDAIAALTAAPNATVPDGDSAQRFKVGAQVPLLHDLALGSVTFAKGSVLQVDKVIRDAKGKVAKLDLRETTGKLRLVRGVAVEQFLVALAPDDVTWPDGAVGATIQLGRGLQLGEMQFAKGTRFVVTRVQEAKNGRGVVKVSLREVDGSKREVEDVPVAMLKQNGALGTAEGAPK